MHLEPQHRPPERTGPREAMIDSANAAIDVDALMDRLRERVAEVRQKGPAGDPLGARALRGNLFINALEAYANIADRKSQIRSQWPSHIGDRFPFKIERIRVVSLKLLAFLFKDQRHVNVAIVSALREQISLNRHLVEQIANLREQVDALKLTAAPNATILDGDR